MTVRAQKDGLHMMLLGCAAFLLLGIALENAVPTSMSDFRELYFPARTLIRQSDPYRRSEVQRNYQAEGGVRQSDTGKEQQIATLNPYPPSAFILTAPVALLPFFPAQLLWMTFTMGSLVFASFLVWKLAEDTAPSAAGYLIGFLLANSEVLAITGSAAGVVISLCTVAVWCFVRGRFIWAGILCFTLSLAIRPHVTGLVWLYFLLAGGAYRKRALQTLVTLVAMCVPVVLWVWRVSPHWLDEMNANLRSYSLPGGINDPGPASSGGHGLDMVISLQAVVSFLVDDPRVYKAVSYLVCAPLLLAWAWITLRSQPSLRRVWLGLASIAPLSLLPIYHRQLDAKLLLLTVPACALLWAEGGRIGRLALLVTSAGFVLTADLPWAIVLGIISRLHQPTSPSLGRMLLAAQVLPTPLILLVMAVFYLWAYATRSCGPIATAELETGERNAG